MKNPLIILQILTFCFIVCVNSATAQGSSTTDDFASTSKNFVFVEAFGSGGLYSINFDRLLTPTWSARLGVSSFK